MFNFSAAHGATTGESVGVSIPTTLPDNIRAYYQTMSTQDLSNQLALDEEAKDVMLVPRWENCASIHMRFKGKPEGAVLAALSGKFYVKVRGAAVRPFCKRPGWIAPSSNEPVPQEEARINTPWGIKTCRRPAINNRDDGVARAEYTATILKSGLNFEGRSPAVMKEAAPHEKWCHDSNWVLGGCTCIESWYIGKASQPESALIGVTETLGFQGVIMIHMHAPSDVEHFYVLEQNKWQHGAAYNLQQFIADILVYQAAWTSHKEASHLTATCWGTGDMSHDRRTVLCVCVFVISRCVCHCVFLLNLMYSRQCWKFLCDTW